ncbi:MAG: ATP synthase subunit C [Chlamydiia bacterium]|nr:ATP synthase subunit C [Chlamydiia bacterium]
MEMINVGPAIVVCLGCIGSAIGVSKASMASHGAMIQAPSGSGKYIMLSAVPSSQSIYGFVLMLLMKAAIVAESISQESAVIIGLFSGFALLTSAIFQGKVAATAIMSVVKNPNVFGKTMISIGMIESFALFAFIFVVMLFSGTGTAT